MFGVEIKFGILIVSWAGVVVLGFDGSGLFEDFSPGPQGERWGLHAFFFVVIVSGGRRDRDLFFVDVAAKLDFLYKRRRYIATHPQGIAFSAHVFFFKERLKVVFGYTRTDSGRFGKI